jgi:hypothetical protein
MAPLTEIGEIELLGIKYKLGKNGNVRLVTEAPDVWGKIRGEEVTLSHWLGASALTSQQEEKVQALLDHLGDALSRLRQSRDSKLGVGQQGEK